MPTVPYRTRTRGDKSGRSLRASSAKEKVARMLTSAFRRRKTKKALSTPAKKQVRTMVKREIGRQAETLMNFGRTLYQPAGTAINTFQGARYYLANVGGSIAINDETMPPFKNINAIAVNQNIAGGLSAYNQTYHGQDIFGKYMRTKIKLTMPSIRSVPTGGVDWQQMPQNYCYRMIFFKSKPQPAINTAAAGFTNAPFCLNGFKNEVGSTFGISSTDAESLPDITGALQPFINDDLMRAPVNKTNFTVLYERRGKISPGSAQNATANPTAQTQGPKQYPSEADFTFTHKINKKLNLQLESTTAQPLLPGQPGTSRVTNLDTSICFFLVLCPAGEGIPSSQSSAAIWNEAIVPHLSVHSTFTFTDM